MQQASSGLRAQIRRQLHSPPGGVPGPSTSRSIHIPAYAPRSPPKSSPTSPQTVFRQARTFLARLVGQLTAPGTSALGAHAPQTSRPLHSGALRFETIQQRLNAPTRNHLARPFGAPILPRGPVAPRNITHVGLGTARNFSSGRPLFQNIAENVPIAGRAFWEADWAVRAQKERDMEKLKKRKQDKENRQAMKALKAEPVHIHVPAIAAAQEEEARAHLDHYFPAPAVPEVTTYLLVPLAPTPTSRLPLQVTPSTHTSNHPLIPFSYIASIHSDHATHTLRVSSLFARLDQSHVFDAPEVTCSAFGHTSGLCTVLEVKFAGWTEARVRSVIGEGGTGWCVLEEVREDDKESESMDDMLSEMSFNTGLSSPVRPEQMEVNIDPSTSFVLPTLDFSASFPAETSSWARASAHSPLNTPMSDLEFHNAWSSHERDSDSLSDISDSFSLDSEALDGWAESVVSSRRSSIGSAESWSALGFSSSFARRMQDDDGVDEPREYMF